MNDGTQTWVVGSRMYGIHTPKSDYDRMSVCFRRGDFIDPLSEREWSQVVDQTTTHSLAKFARLLVRGNPTIIDVVHHQPEEVVPVINDFVEAVRPYTLTQDLAKSYLGYITTQRNRGFKQSGEHGTRKEHYELGYDPKYIGHLVRLSWQLNSLLSTGGYGYLSEDEKNYIRALRASPPPLEDIMPVVESLTNFETVNLDVLPTTEKLRQVISEYFLGNF